MKWINEESEENEIRLACATGDVIACEYKIKQGVSADFETRMGNSLLLIAVVNGKDEMVKMLLRNGAQVNRVSSRGFTAVGEAVRFMAEDMLNILIEHGADVNRRDGEGMTALERLVFETPIKSVEKHERMLKILLEAGGDPRLKNPDTQKTVLEESIGKWLEKHMIPWMEAELFEKEGEVGRVLKKKKL